MENSEPILPRKDDVKDKLQLNSVEEDRSDRLELVGRRHEGGEGENISVPFFRGNLSLAQVQEMQRKARKKSKLPARLPVFEPSIEMNRVPDHVNKSEPIQSTYKLHGNSSPSSEKRCLEERNKSKLGRKIVDKRDKSCHRARELKSCSESNRSSLEKSIDKIRVENRDNETRIKKQSNSYLEQYRKRRELKERTNSPESKSLCSSKSQFSLDLSSTFHTDIERVSEVGSSCLCSSSEEILYREIVDSDLKTHSSAKSSFVSCKSSLGSNEDGPSSSITSKESEDCGSKNAVNGESTNKRTKKSTILENEFNKSSTSSPPVPHRLARSLGQALEDIKPKLTALQKRNEYGNKMSFINRENNQEKHSSDGNKMQNSSNNEEDGVPIPIITYTIDQFDSSQLLKKPSPQIQKRKKRMNTKKKTTDLEHSTDAREVKLMIQRHEEEKRQAENIKHQLLLK